MKNLLVITGMYLPTPSANGACLDEILKEYYSLGYESYVVSLTNEDYAYETEYCKVYAVKSGIKMSKNRMISKLQSGMFQLRYYPLVSNKTIQKSYDLCKKIIAENEIHMVLCVQLPESAGYIGSMLKDEYPEIPIVLYELDSLADNFSNYTGWKKYFSKRNDDLETKIYPKMDLILHLKSHEKFYSSERYSSYADKSIIVDMPLITSETYDIATSRAIDRNSTIKCVYSGVLTKNYRSPEYLLALVSGVKNLIHIQIDFYSRGDCEEMLHDYEDNILKDTVFCHGYIPKEELDAETGKADVLISIGNAFNDKVFAMPSKIFYYMSMGKPILHIAPNKHDLCLEYLEKYPKAIVIFQDDPLESNVEKLIRFFNSLDGKRVPFDEITSIFKRNTPRYTVDAIEAALVEN